MSEQVSIPPKGPAKRRCDCLHPAADHGVDGCLHPQHGIRSQFCPCAIGAQANPSERRLAKLRAAYDAYYAEIRQQQQLGIALGGNAA